MDFRLPILTLVLLAGGSALQAQEHLSRDQAIEDVRYAIEALEQVHPDPYSAFGGRVEFRREAQALLDGVPEDGLTPSGLYDLLRPLYGKLGDGHTYISAPPSPGSSRPNRYLPVRLAVAIDAVFVQSATDDYRGLIGHRLVSLEGKSVETAAQMVSTVRPVENVFGAWRWLARYIASRRGARRVFPNVQDSLSVRLEAPNGQLVERRLPYYLEVDAYRDGPWVINRWSAVAENADPFHWQFLGDSSVAYLRVASIVGREAFEELKAVGRQDLGEQVQSYYRRYVAGPMPEQVDEAIAGVPCFTGAVRDVLSAMRDRGSEHLLLDLRGNGGGWSALVAAFLLLTYGDRYFEYDFPVTFVTRISQAFLDLSGKTLNEFNAQLGTDYKIGDYRFMEEESLTSRYSREEYAVELEPYGCGLASDFRRLNGNPLYSPSVLVLVDPGTFSAAYHFVYRLRHLGAKVVGVPPAQAGNAFVDVTRYELPNSKLDGSIARTAQILFPTGEGGGKVLMPAFPMGWAEYRRYEFDAQSEVLYALELITAGKTR